MTFFIRVIILIISSVSVPGKRNDIIDLPKRTPTHNILLYTVIPNAFGVVCIINKK